MCYATKAMQTTASLEESDMGSASVPWSDHAFHCSCESCGAALPLPAPPRVVSLGDIVTIDLEMLPENNFVPESLFDRNGTITFVVGWGNYLPGLHELVQGKGIGDQVSRISIDAGWGDRNPDLVMELPMTKLKRFFNKDGSFPEVGTSLPLQGDLQLTVIQVNKDKETVLVDANPPLAGASYSCSFTILSIDNLPQEAALLPSSTTNQQGTHSRYMVSTWALGCFWGGELAFMRVPGVVGTRVGYTQGTMINPTYEIVCTGKTHHREALMVVYDPEVVSYKTLLGVAISRLAATNEINKPATMFGDMFAEDDDEKDSKQYSHGFYFHSKDQQEIAEQELASNNPYDIEIMKAAMFYDAEDMHQQYLLKGGQSARKGAKETIRCYG